MRDVADHASGDRLRISRPEGLSVHVLRLWRPDAATLGALEGALGAPLPTAPNTAAGDSPRLLWMGPEEWAVIGAGEGLADRVASACGAALHHLADVTDGRVLIDIEGPAAPDLMAKGCGLDFHPRGFPGGTCAQSLFAQLRVLIERPSDAPAFRLVVDRTYLAHLDAWLRAAGAEFLEPAK